MINRLMREKKLLEAQLRDANNLADQRAQRNIALEAENARLRQQRAKLAGLLLGLKVSVRDRAAGRAILADDVYKLIDAALSELTP